MRTSFPRCVGFFVLIASLGCGDASQPSSEPSDAAISDGAGHDGADAPADPDEPAEPVEIVLRFGVVTRAEPRLTVAGSQPLIDYLDRATPYRVELRMGRSSEDVELDPGMQDLVTFLEERLVDIAPLGVLSYCLADERFGAVALVQSVNDNGAPLERAAFVTAPASDIRKLEHLRGKRIALGPSHSMLSHVLATHTLASAGISADTTNLESDGAVIDAVLRGDYDAGVVAEHVVDESVRVFHVSISIPSRPLVVRADLPEPVQTSLRTALLDLDPEAASGWDRLFRNGFAPSSAVDYGLVRRILNEQGARCTQSCHQPVRFRKGE